MHYHLHIDNVKPTVTGSLLARDLGEARAVRQTSDAMQRFQEAGSMGVSGGRAEGEEVSGEVRERGSCVVGGIGRGRPCGCTGSVGSV